jgi:hypothetical protein
MSRSNRGFQVQWEDAFHRREEPIAGQGLRKKARCISATGFFKCLFCERNVGLLHCFDQVGIRISSHLGFAFFAAHADFSFILRGLSGVDRLAADDTFGISRFVSSDFFNHGLGIRVELGFALFAAEADLFGILDFFSSGGFARYRTIFAKGEAHGKEEGDEG